MTRSEYAQQYAIVKGVAGWFLRTYFQDPRALLFCPIYIRHHPLKAGVSPEDAAIYVRHCLRTHKEARIYNIVEVE